MYVATLLGALIRDYGLEPQVWDDPGGCEHEWKSEMIYKDAPTRKRSADCFTRESTRKDERWRDNTWCIKCNAWRGSLGLEPTPELFIQHIVQVFREVRRVLRKDGTCWVNIGDSYASGGGSGSHGGGYRGGHDKSPKAVADNPLSQPNRQHIPGLKPKDLCGIPWRVFFALQADGWWGRSGLPWVKRSSMPESVDGWRWEQHRVKVKAGWDDKNPHPSKGNSGKSRIDNSGGTFKAQAEWQDCPGCPKCTPNDGLILRKGSGRPTSALEYVFLLTKSEDYYFDMESVRKPQVEYERARRLREKSQGLDTVFNIAADGKTGQTPQSQGGSIRNAKARQELAELGTRSFRNTDLFFESIEPPHGMIFAGDEPVGLDVNPQAFKGSHFATFGEKLVMPLIKCSTSQKGCCPECGANWVRVVEKSYRNDTTIDGRPAKGNTRPELREDAGDVKVFASGERTRLISKTIGWKPSCKCIKNKHPNISMTGYEWLKLIDEKAKEFKPIPCTVLDPFAGSCRALIVAKKLGRRGIGIDLKGEYLDMPRKELAQERLF